MNEAMKALIQYMIAYGGLITLFFFIVNFLQKGFLLRYLIVKASQGRKTLVEVSAATDDYYTTGKWEDGFFKFKNRAKEQKAISINEPSFKSLITHIMGVSKVIVDETGNKFITKDWDTVKFQVDSGRLNTDLIRIKNRPIPKSKQETLIILLLIAAIVGIGFLLFRVIQIEEAIVALGELTGNI